MDEWSPLAIEQSPSTTNHYSDGPSLDGFSPDASMLQAQFETESTHLSEVRQLHTEVLVTAGMLPETSLAEAEPERALSWVVESINGRMNPDGLTIPMLGTTYDNLHLRFKTINDQTVVQLQVDDGDLPPLVKEIPLPKEASSNLTAEFSNGRLHLRW